MAVYFYCEDTDGFPEAERTLLEDYRWTKDSIDQLWGPNSKDYVFFRPYDCSVQVNILPMNPLTTRIPVPQAEVPEPFSKLLEILKPVHIKDESSRVLSISQLVGNE